MGLRMLAEQHHLWDNKTVGRPKPSDRYTPLVLRPKGGALVSVTPAASEGNPAPPDVPTSVYRYYDKNGVLLYVGVTGRGTARNVEHNKSKEWFQFVARQEVEHYPNRGKALRRETELIRQYRPPFNTQQNPGYQLTRQAYLSWDSSPATHGLRIQSPQKLPKIVFFVPGGIQANVVLLRCDTSLSDFSVVGELPHRIGIRGEDGKRVGQLIDMQHLPGGFALRARMLDTERLTLVRVGIKWRQPKDRILRFEILNARACYLDDSAVA